MNKFLDQKFFNRPTLEVAENLIGQIITNGKEKLVINEVEAYDGPNDLACHASKGLTLRTKIMFGSAGNFYVYLCYGMHWMLNIVTGPKDYPSAILIRGANLVKKTVSIHPVNYLRAIFHLRVHMVPRLNRKNTSPISQPI